MPDDMNYRTVVDFHGTLAPDRQPAPPRMNVALSNDPPVPCTEQQPTPRTNPLLDASFPAPSQAASPVYWIDPQNYSLLNYMPPAPSAPSDDARSDMLRAIRDWEAVCAMSSALALQSTPAGKGDDPPTYRFMPSTDNPRARKYDTNVGTVDCCGAELHVGDYVVLMREYADSVKNPWKIVAPVYPGMRKSNGDYEMLSLSRDVVTDGGVTATTCCTTHARMLKKAEVPAHV